MATPRAPFMLRLRRRLDLLLAGLAAVLFLASLLFAAPRTNEYRELLSIEDVWSSNHLKVDYLGIIIAIHRVRDGAPRSELDLAVDIFYSRHAALNQGAFARFYSDSAEFNTAMATVGSALTQVDAILARTSAPLGEAELAALEQALAPLPPRINDLRLLVNATRSVQQDRLLREADQQGRRFFITFAVAMVSFGLCVWIYLAQAARLRRRARYFRATFDRAGVGIAHLDLAGRVLRANTVMEHLLGPAAAQRGGPWPLLELCNLRPDRLFEPLVAGNRTTLKLDSPYSRYDGVQSHAEFTFSLADEPGRSSTYIIVVMEDVGDRRSMEAQLQHAQRMEAVGQLTGGVAHDFNNLLGVVVGNLDLLRRQLKDNPKAVTLIQRAIQAAERGASLTRRLLSFSRREVLKPEKVDPNLLVDDAASILRPTLGDEFEIVLKLGSNVPHANVDPGQLEAALFNLAINARDAMSPGGRLTIGTRTLRLARSDVRRELPAGEYVVIEVGDTGAGIPPEVLSRVFEPFFTTKAEGKGSGLGLSMVYGFAKQSGGHVEIESEVGRGSCVRIILPAAVRQAEAA